MNALQKGEVAEDDGRDLQERIGFARGVLEIMRGTGLFNFLIDRAIDDLDVVASDLGQPKK